MTSRKIAAAALVAALPLTAVAAVPATAATTTTQGATTTVPCRGTTSATACVASVSLAGGASNERVVVNLPGPGYRLRSVRPTSTDLDGAYLVSDQASTQGGRQYAFTLSAAEAPRGSALLLRFQKPRARTPQIVRCTGSRTACQATVPLAGGASNRKVVIQLPATDLGLVAVTPSSPSLRGAYSMTRQHLRAGESEFVFVLSAVQAAPKGSHLTLSFAKQ